MIRLSLKMNLLELTINKILADYNQINQSGNIGRDKGEFMSNINDPLKTLLNDCEDTIKTGEWKLSPSLIQEAKDQLAKIQELNSSLSKELYIANEEYIKLLNSKIL
jgi:hypothetical protein